MKKRLSGILSLILYAVMSLVIAFSCLAGCETGNNSGSEQEQTVDIEMANMEAQIVVGKIAALPDTDELSPDNYSYYTNDIELAYKAYNALSTLSKSYVTNYTKLLSLQSGVRMYKIHTAISNLSEIEDITLEDEKAVSNVRKSFNALTDVEQETFKSDARTADAYEKFFLAECKVNALVVKSKIDEIDISAITLADEVDVKALRQEYNHLYDVTLVTNYEVLINAENKIKALKVVEIVASVADSEEIDSLSNIIVVAQVNNAIKAYEALSPSERTYVDTVTVNKVNALSKRINDLERVALLIEKVDLIGEVTLNPTKIANAKSFYDEMTDDQKSLVPEETLDLLFGKISEFNANVDIAKKVTDKISALKNAEEILLADETAVNDARDAYDRLKDEYKPLVTNYEKLVEDEQRILNIKKANEVNELIDLLPSDFTQTTLEDVNNIKNAVIAYEKLTDIQKEIVGETQSVRLYGCLNFYVDNFASLDKDSIESLISKIDLLTEEDEAEAIVCRNEYNALDLIFRLLVTNVDKLIDIEDKIAAKKVVVLIDEIPSLNVLTSVEVGIVNNAKSAYNALSENAKGMVSNYSKLLICQEMLGNFAFRGKINYVIVLSDNASSDERKAANALNDFFYEIYGYKVDIVSDMTVNFSIDSQYVVIGRSDLLYNAGITVPESCGDMGYIVKTYGTNIFISSYSGNGVGVVSGVYKFLSEYFGYKGYAIDEVIYEDDDTILFNSLDDEESPDITAFSMTGDGRDAEFQRAIAGISHHTEIFSTGLPYHNTLTIVDPGRYGSIHPSWFSSDSTQLCYTAHGDYVEYEALVEVVYTELRKQYDTAKKNGREEIILTFTQNDNGTFCNCDECKKYNQSSLYNDSASLGQRGGYNYSIPIVLFMNKLSDRFERAGIEDVKLVFFSYLQTETAPLTNLVFTDENLGLNETPLTMRDNVIPMIAPIYPVYSREESFDVNGIQELIEQWLALSEAENPQFLLWTYSANYQNYLAPYDPFTCISDNFKIMSEYSKNGQLIFWYDEGAGDDETIGSGFTYFRFWLQGKLAMDSTFVDTEEKFNAAIDEFFNAYYKEAAPFMKQYFNSYVETLRELHGDTTNEGYRFYGYTFDDFPNFYDVYTYQVGNSGKKTEPWFSKTLLEDWRNTLSKAKSATEGTIAHSRVLLESTMVDYLYLKLYGIDLVSNKDLTELNKQKAQWYADMAECGLTHIRESEELDTAFATKLGSNRLSATISDLQVLAIEAGKFNSNSALKDIYDLCENFERIYNSDLHGSYFGRFSAEDQAKITNAYADYSNNISKELYNRVLAMLNTLPDDVNDIDMFDGAKIALIKSMYERLNDTYQTNINNSLTIYNKYTSSVEYYEERWGVAYNELEAWVYSGSIGEKANVGCDSYRSNSECSMVEDETYGTVTEIKVINAKFSDQPTAVNFSALFSGYSSAKTAVRNNSDIIFVRFWVKMSADSLQVSTGTRSFTTFNIKPDEWSLIELTRDQFLNGQGAIRRERYHNKNIYITNLYFITANSLAELVQEEVEAFPEDTSLLVMFDNIKLDEAVKDFSIIENALGLERAKELVGLDVYDKLTEYTTYYNQRWIPFYDYSESIPFKNKVDGTWGTQVNISAAVDEVMGNVMEVSVKVPSNGNTQYTFDVNEIKAEIERLGNVAAVRFYAYMPNTSDATWYLRFDIGAGWSGAKNYTIKRDEWSEVEIDLDTFNTLTGSIYTMYAARPIFFSNFYLVTQIGLGDSLINKIDSMYEEFLYTTYKDLLPDYNSMLEAYEGFEYKNVITNASKLSEMKVNLVNWYVTDLTPVDSMTLENIVGLMTDSNVVRDAIAKLSDSEKSRIPTDTNNAYNAYLSKLDELKSGYVNELITKIKGFSEIKVENGKDIFDAVKWYNSLIDKSMIEDNDVLALNEALAQYNESWYVASDYFDEVIYYPINNPWTGYSDSYRALTSMSLDRDDVYSDVVKVTVTKNTTGTCDGNMQFRFDIAKVLSQFQGKTDAAAIMFFAKSTSASTIYLSTTENRYTKLPEYMFNITEADTWTPLVLSREQFEASNGVIFRDGYVGDEPIEIYFTNFYILTADEYVKPLIAKIEAIKDLEKAGYLESVATVKAIRAEYNDLSNIAKASVTNISDLENVEVNVASWYIEDMTSAEDMLRENYLSLVDEVGIVSSYYNSLSNNERAAIEASLSGKYENALIKLASIKVDYLAYLIDEMSASVGVKAIDYANIEFIVRNYATLTSVEKARITNYSSFNENVVVKYEERYSPAFDYTTSIPLKNKVDGTFGSAVNISTEFINGVGNVLVSKVTNPSNFNTQYTIDLTAIKEAIASDDKIIGVKFYAYYEGSDKTFPLRFDIGGGYSTAVECRMTKETWTEFYFDSSEVSNLTGTFYTMYANPTVKISNFFLTKIQAVVDETILDINNFIDNFDTMSADERTVLITKINAEYANLGENSTLVDTALYNLYLEKSNEHYLSLAQVVIDNIENLYTICGERNLLAEDYAYIYGAKLAYDNLPYQESKDLVNNLDKLEEVEEEFNKMYTVLMMYDMTSTANFKKEDYGGREKQILSVVENDTFGNALRIDIPADFNSQHAPQSYLNFPDITGYETVVSYVYNGGTANKTVNLIYNVSGVEVTATAGEWTKIVVKASKFTSNGRMLVYSCENGKYYLFSPIYAVKATEYGTAKLLDDEITALAELIGEGGITFENYTTYMDSVEELYAKYESLTDTSPVTLADTLIGYANVVFESKAQSVDAIISNLMTKGINNLEENDYGKIYVAKSMYENLSDSAKLLVEGKDDLDALYEAINDLYIVYMINDMKAVVDDDVSLGAASAHHYEAIFDVTSGYLMRYKNDDKGNMRALITYNVDLTGYNIHVHMTSSEVNRSMYWDYNGSWATSPTIKVGEWTDKVFTGIDGSASAVTLKVGINGDNEHPTNVGYFYLAPIYAVKLNEGGYVRILNTDTNYALPNADELTVENYGSYIDLINEVYGIYDSLSTEYKDKIEDRENIVACYEKLPELKLSAIDGAIDTLLELKASEYKPSDYNLFYGVEYVYNTLSDDEKTQIDSDKLSAYETAKANFNGMYEVIMLEDMKADLINSTEYAGESAQYHKFIAKVSLSSGNCYGAYGPYTEWNNEDGGNFVSKLSYNTDLTGYTIYVTGISPEKTSGVNFLFKYDGTQSTPGISSTAWKTIEFSGKDGTASDIVLHYGINTESGGISYHYYFLPIFAAKKTETFDVYKANAIINELPDVDTITVSNYTDYSATIVDIGELYDGWVADDNQTSLGLFNADAFNTYSTKIGGFMVAGLVEEIDTLDELILTADAYSYISGLKYAYDNLSTSLQNNVTNYNKLEGKLSKFNSMYDVIDMLDMSEGLTNSLVVESGAKDYHHFEAVTGAVGSAVAGRYGKFNKVWNGDVGNIAAEYSYDYDLTGYTIYVISYSNKVNTCNYYKYNGAEIANGNGGYINAGKWNVSTLTGKDGSSTPIQMLFGINMSGEATSDNYYYFAPIYAVKASANADVELFKDVMAILANKQELTLEDVATVKFANDKYNALSGEQKSTIVNITDLEIELNGYKADLRAIVQSEIDAIVVESITLASENEIKAIREDYKLLFDNAGITLDKLVSAENKISALKAIAKIDLINETIEELTLEDESTVTTARSAYNALSEAQKAFVDSAYVTKLTNAEYKISALKVEASITELAGYSDYVNYLDALTKETEGFDDLASAVEDIKTAYGELTGDGNGGKMYFDTAFKTVLDAYDTKIYDLKNAATETDASIAVKTAITTLGKTKDDIAITDYVKFYAIEVAYNNLSTNEQADVNANSNYEDLYSALHNAYDIIVLDLTASSWGKGTYVNTISNDDDGNLVVVTKTGSAAQIFARYDGRGEADYSGYTLYVDIKASATKNVTIDGGTATSVGTDYTLISAAYPTASDKIKFVSGVVTYTIDCAFVAKAK